MRRFILSLAALFAVSAVANAQIFQAGNLVVYQVGDGTAALTSAATPAALSQYTISGTPVGSPLVLPSTGAGAFTNAGTSTSEGFLQLSGNGQFLYFAGYNVAAGTLAVAGTTGTVAPRSVGQVDQNGNFVLSSLGTLAYSGGNPRSAYGTDGSNVWTGGSNQGVQYHVIGSGTTTGALSAAPTNVRVVSVINNQLYTSASSGAFVGVSTVGTGTPTTTGQTTTALPGFPTTAGPSNYQYVGINSPTNPNSFNGIDTLYVADDRITNGSGGIQRWNYDGTNWVNSGTITPPDAAGTGFVGLRGLTATIAGSTVALYGTTTEVSGNRLVTVTDTLSGLTGTFGAFSNLATAPTNTVFRGVSFAPVPEPTSLLAVATGTLLFGRWVRRRKASK
jgi:hypothetical protein